MFPEPQQIKGVTCPHCKRECYHAIALSSMASWGVQLEIICEEHGIMNVRLGQDQRLYEIGKVDTFYQDLRKAKRKPPMTEKRRKAEAETIEWTQEKMEMKGKKKK